MTWNRRHVLAGTAERERRADADLPHVVATAVATTIQAISVATVARVRGESDWG
jgi:hypothetical protein